MSRLAHAVLASFGAAILVVAGACSSGGGGGAGGSGGSGGDDNGDPTGDCASVTNVSDGPTADSIGANAQSIVCYYHQPSEGYCRKITSSAEIQNFYSGGNDKGAIGCKDAVILTDAECPTKNAVAKCTDTTIEAERLYYTCSKFPNPGDNCAAVGGTFTEL